MCKRTRQTCGVCKAEVWGARDHMHCRGNQTSGRRSGAGHTHTPTATNKGTGQRGRDRECEKSRVGGGGGEEQAGDVASLLELLEAEGLKLDAVCLVELVLELDPVKAEGMQEALQYIHDGEHTEGGGRKHSVSAKRGT
jgi:hypothetical protein